MFVVSPPFLEGQLDEEIIDKDILFKICAIEVRDFFEEKAVRMLIGSNIIDFNEKQEETK